MTVFSAGRNVLALILIWCLLLCNLHMAYGDVWMFPEVVLASDGTGDFGPTTPNTRTAGWQEAIDYCVVHNRDLSVKGTNYDIYGSIVIPSCKTFRIDSRVCTLRWKGQPGDDMLVLNSARGCRFAFGILSYNGTGAAIRLKPHNLVPGENSAGFYDSVVNIASVLYPGASQPAVRYSIGVVFDTSSGPIANNDFCFTNILNHGVNLASVGSAFEFSHNRVKCMDMYTNTTGGTIVSMGDRAKQNIFRIAVGADQGAAGVKGVDLSGSDNSLEVITKGGFALGNDLVLEASSAGNQISIVADSSVADVFGLITDNATNPTNQVTNTGAPMLARTLAVPAGTYSYTQRLCSATIRVVGGAVSSMKLTRGAATVDYGASASDIMMAVGDRLEVTSSVGPSMQIIPVKTR